MVTPRPDIYGAYMFSGLSAAGPTVVTRAAGWLGRWTAPASPESLSDVIATLDVDPLTGLINRRRVRAEADRLIRANTPATVLLLDLDRFSEVNDALGCVAGDQLLAAVAHRLRREVPDGSFVARHAGDEFALLLPGTNNPRAAYLTAQRVLECFRGGFVVGDDQLHMDASIGIAVAPYHGADAETLLAAADLALTQAKLRGGGTTCFFEPHLRHQVEAQRVLREALRRALDNDEFELLYQPQFAFETGSIVGVEALIRWNHPEYGRLIPSQFLPELAALPISSLVGDWVLRTAVAQAAQWRDEGLPLRVGVNLFASQFHASDLAARVDDLLIEARLPAELLELEVTETVALSNCVTVKVALEALRARGVGIALDDFGTGYASLELVKTLPVSRLKIDKSFVQDLRAGTCDAVLVEMITRLARTLRLEVIAEGIETASQERWLKGSGCEEGQGYRYGKPMPADEVTDWANKVHAQN